ncbi:hypothetical protein N780_09980 [Pontibacillus chungwhensis BH030062]|uniref:Aerobactin siderophore biosynthesis IucA/IucC-like C-terminal domain-containing protein n=1 Tax=Pontibacillus chungwhensis BH030062 TaxID=1385513 RepID=A0A0A2UNF7_9BACI|nr:hypothetical protein [Pontibacillus chungwhensis]KGP89802.1 hypothetical protein N780_09980 [Pontibacillus chungwhensis BH030062]
MNLTLDEVDVLDHYFRYYHPTYHDGEQRVEEISLDAFRDVNQFKEILEQVSSFINSDSQRATASMITKRLGYYFVTGMLAPMTLYSKLPVVEVEDKKLIRLDDHKKWFPKWSNESYRSLSIPKSAREKSVKHHFTVLIETMVLPIFTTVHRVTSLPMKIMWENFATYVYWFYEQFAYEIVQKAQANTVLCDYQAIRGIEGKVFQQKQNPITQFALRKEKGKEKRLFCCLTYQLNNEHTYCKVCPLLKN